MTFNIWVDGVYGGQPLSQTAEVIRRAEADVVGMQEVKKNGQQIADLLSWNYQHLGRDTAILSRYEIGAVTPEKTGAKLQLDDGQVVYLCNVHLAHAPYQPYQLLGIPYHDAPFLNTAEEAVAAAEGEAPAEAAEKAPEAEKTEESSGD